MRTDCSTHCEHPAVECCDTMLCCADRVIRAGAIVGMALGHRGHGTGPLYDTVLRRSIRAGPIVGGARQRRQRHELERNARRERPHAARKAAQELRRNAQAQVDSPHAAVAACVRCTTRDAVCAFAVALRRLTTVRLVVHRCSLAWLGSTVQRSLGLALWAEQYLVCAWCGSQGYLVTSIILTAFLGAVIVRNFRAAAAWASIGAAASAIGLIHSYELKVPLSTHCVLTVARVASYGSRCAMEHQKRSLPWTKHAAVSCVCWRLCVQRLLPGRTTRLCAAHLFRRMAR